MEGREKEFTASQVFLDTAFQKERKPLVFHVEKIRHEIIKGFTRLFQVHFSIIIKDLFLYMLRRMTTVACVHSKFVPHTVNPNEKYSSLPGRLQDLQLCLYSFL